MKIFIAGATGIIGKRVCTQLIKKGHEVVGLSRSDKNDEQLKALGVEAKRADLFNLKSLYEASMGCDGIIHLASSIPTKNRPSKRDWKMNNMIKWEGTQNLIEAVFRHKSKFYIQQSNTFLYGSSEDEVDEFTYLPHDVLSFHKSAQQLEWIVQDAIKDHRLPGIVLRLGGVYSEEDHHTTSLYKMMKSGKFMSIGEDKQYWSLIHADDAASAFVCAVEKHEDCIGKYYNVVDDEPVVARKLHEYMWEQFGNTKKLGKMAPFLAKLLLGKEMVTFFKYNCKVKNNRIKTELGWEPKYKTYREGFKAAIENWKKDKIKLGKDPIETQIQY